MKILGIDDNEDLLNLCDIALSSDGHEYTGINNGKEGLDAIKNEKFDIVLLDLSMPDFSGVDVVDALVKDGLMNKQKIIIFTASSATEKEYAPLLEKGAHSILKKPLDIDVLLETINKIAS
ncbi:MAG: response regulator [Thaumarchaeota archaeon]|nr:response regulator [Nitrososphaerota archaeon]